MPYKGALELWYVAHQSLWTDFKILAATAVAVLWPGWTGYKHWFHGLPAPDSSLLREHFGHLRTVVVAEHILLRAER